MKLSKQLTIGVLGVTCMFTFGVTHVSATTAVVNVQSLNLRERASASSDMVDGLVKGQELEVLEELDGWYKVKADGEIGYVSADYVTIKDVATTEESQEENNQEETSNEIDTSENESTNNEETNNIEENKEETNNENVNQETTNTNSNNNETKQEKNNEKVVKEFEIKEATLNINSKAYILPLLNSNVLKELKEGSKVTISDEAGNWYYIQDEEISGWVLKTAFGEVINKIEENNQEEPNNEEQVNQEEQQNTENQEENKQEENIQETEIEKKKMYVNNASGINIRKGPGTDYEKIDSLAYNDEVYVIAESDDWYKIEVDDKTGYVAKRLLSEEKETTSRNSEERIVEEKSSEEQNITTVSSTSSSIGDEIVEFAKQYLGCKYVYGGSGPNTFDCSGFTMYVFKNFGVNLSHSARAQAKEGEYVDKDDLMPGDLVFFKDYETMDGIGHCGIYIGDGDFIHASSGTGYCVKISTLLSGSYLKRYDTARRIF